MGISASTVSRATTADETTDSIATPATIASRPVDAFDPDRVHCVRDAERQQRPETRVFSVSTASSDVDDSNDSNDSDNSVVMSERDDDNDDHAQSGAIRNSDVAHDNADTDQRPQGQHLETMRNIVNENESSAVDGVTANTATPSSSAGVADRIVGDSRRTRHRDVNDGGADDANKDKSLDEFREELRIKREQRRTAIADLKNEVHQLRSDLADERRANEQLRAMAASDNKRATNDDVEDDDSSDDNSDDGDETDTNETANAEPTNQPRTHRRRRTERKLRMQLANVNHQLQLANSEVLSLSAELKVTQTQVGTLKEVIAVSKDVMNIREVQLDQLKSKLKEIEDTLAERELTIMSDTLRKEYDRQLANIRSLRTLYEERARISAAEKENLNRQLDTKQAELETELAKSSALEIRVTSLETDLQDSNDNLTNVKDDLIDCKMEKKGLEEETAVINQLFSQLLSGFKGGSDIDINKLATVLEDNRDLLNEITSSEMCQSRAAAVPKLLLDLVSQIDEKEAYESSIDETDNRASRSDVEIGNPEINTAPLTSKKTQILQNLPKVWKVLIELLNHQTAETVPFRVDGDSEDCYNLIASPNGPQHVLSVSKTYIRLKDLILEKKFLQNETHKLKNLNGHLETRLDQKERRLAAVTVELNKTWTLVGRMQRQRRQLHTNEQVLRYQLSQKRRMLSELKEELEYCRRKWTLAREKNELSQTQWNTLRREFTARKMQDARSQLSAESGYSDEPVSDDDTEAGPIDVVELEVCEGELVAAAECLSSELVDQIEQENVALVSVPAVDQQQASTSTAVAMEGAVGGDINAVGDNTKPPKTNRMRRKKTKVPKERKPETLEEMFNRISGQPAESESSSEYSESDEEVGVQELIFIAANNNESDTSSSMPVETSVVLSTTTDEIAAAENPLATVRPIVRIDREDEERQQRRAMRFDRLETQCQQLMKQVQRTTTRGAELDKQLDDVHQRYSRYKEPATANVTSATEDVHLNDDPQPGCSNAPHPSDSTTSTDGLTAREQEYTTRRAERLLRLEAECKAFLSRVSTSNSRLTELNDKATTLHEHHAARTSPSAALPSKSSVCSPVSIELVDAAAGTTENTGIASASSIVDGDNVPSIQTSDVIDVTCEIEMHLNGNVDEALLEVTIPTLAEENVETDQDNGTNETL